MNQLIIWGAIVFIFVGLLALRGLRSRARSRARKDKRVETEGARAPVERDRTDTSGDRGAGQTPYDRARETGQRSAFDVETVRQSSFLPEPEENARALSYLTRVGPGAQSKPRPRHYYGLRKRSEHYSINLHRFKADGEFIGKKCPVCGEVKWLVAFHRHGRSHDEHRNTCITCVRQAQGNRDYAPAPVSAQQGPDENSQWWIDHYRQRKASGEIYWQFKTLEAEQLDLIPREDWE